MAFVVEESDDLCHSTTTPLMEAEESSASSRTIVSYELRPIRVLGQGSFGVVAAAGIVGLDETVAIKRVRCDPRVVNRELSILRDVLQHGFVPYGVERGEYGVRMAPLGSTPSKNSLFRGGHPNIVHLYSYYFSDEVASDGETPERYLHLVMSYLPTDLSQLRRALRQSSMEPSGGIPLLLGKTVLFQVARALAFLHRRHVCHRDVKPSNVLVDFHSGEVQLCDFGSAKQIDSDSGEKNTAYICSRFYRAPELLFGSLQYGAAVDLWSLGCLTAEVLKSGGRALFRGRSTVDQMAEIFKVLGTPTPAEMRAMNPQCAAAMHVVGQQYASRRAGESLDGGPHDILSISSKAWEEVLGQSFLPDNATDLLTRLLRYDPQRRLAAWAVVQHPFFEELFTVDDQPPRVLPSGDLLSPNVFALTEEETQYFPLAFCERMKREEHKILSLRRR